MARRLDLAVSVKTGIFNARIDQKKIAQIYFSDQSLQIILRF